jgi:hypothetical protein
MKWAGLIVGAVAALAVAAPAHASVVINDPAGDANGLGTAALNQSTGPASDASRDITSVTVSREPGNLVVRYALAGAPDLDGPMTTLLLRGKKGACNSMLAVMWGNFGTENAAPSEQGPLAMSDFNGCPRDTWGPTAAGHSVSLNGSTIVARYSLENAFLDSTPLTGLRAQTIVGTYYARGQVSSCYPSPCPWYWPKDYYDSDFVGAIVDSTEQASESAEVSRTVRSVKNSTMAKPRRPAVKTKTRRRV